MSMLEIYTLRILNLFSFTVSKEVFAKAREIVESWCREANAEKLSTRDSAIWYGKNTVYAQYYCRVGEAGTHCTLVIYDKNLAEFLLQALLSELSYAQGQQQGRLPGV